MKKKLLFINGHLNVGGVERSLVDLLRNIDYNKYDIDLLLLEDKGDYLSQIPKGVNIIFVDATKAYGPFLKSLILNLLAFRWSMILYRIVLFFSFKFWKKCLVVFRYILGLNSRYDVAIAYRTTGICMDIAIYTVRSKKKMVWWHNGEINLNLSQIKSYNETLSFFDNVVTVSYACKRMLENTFTYPRHKIMVIPNMVDIKQIFKMAGNISPYTDIVSTRIVSVGRLCPEKHFEEVVIVVKKFLNDGLKDFHWYIIGDGDLRMKLEELIKEQEVGKYITLLGKKDNPYPWIKYADIYVHPSHVESQGLTILEAMSLDIPCVICCSAGPSEFVINGVNALMTESNSDSLYKGVLAMMKNKHKEALTAEAKIMVENRFSTHRIIELFDNQIALY